MRLHSQFRPYPRLGGYVRHYTNSCIMFSLVLNILKDTCWLKSVFLLMAYRTSSRLNRMESISDLKFCFEQFFALTIKEVKEHTKFTRLRLMSVLCLKRRQGEGLLHNAIYHNYQVWVTDPVKEIWLRMSCMCAGRPFDGGGSSFMGWFWNRRQLRLTAPSRRQNEHGNSLSKANKPDASQVDH